MNGLKQRIIGALVLVSLAVIFVPMMFDEPHDERDVRSLDIPEEPPFPEVDVPEPDEQTTGVPDYQVQELTPSDRSQAGDEEVVTPVEVDESAPETPAAQIGNASVDVRPAPETDSEPESETVSKPAPEPSTESRPTPEIAPEGGESGSKPSLAGAWVLQLGSFGDEANARRLRNNVRERGYDAQLQEVVRGDARLTRVFSGPFAEKAEATRAKAVLDEAFNINALVTRGGD